VRKQHHFWPPGGGGGFDAWVMDGMHCVARALMASRSHIDAVRFPAPAVAEYRNF